MRILRGVSSAVLPCGCLAGVYETYDSEIVAVLDARGPACGDPAHQTGHRLVPADLPAGDGVASRPPVQRVPSA